MTATPVITLSAGSEMAMTMHPIRPVAAIARGHRCCWRASVHAEAFAIA
jgi:hypothetical protein